MLCDSVGVIPKPNNGTLRLPLHPAGLHKPEDMPPVPEDPESTPSAQTESITSTAATTTRSPPGSQVETDVVTSKTAAPSHTGTSGEGDDDSDSDSDTSSDLMSSIKDVWDWFTGKIEELIDQISGSDSS